MADQSKDNVARYGKTKGRRYVVLKDGRRIILPPSGGKISKSAIRHAVKKVREQRDVTASVG